MADAVVTITEETQSWIKKVKFAITSATGGTATGTTTESYTGEVKRLVVIPGTTTAQPTNAFDVVVNDEDGYDILAGKGADKSNAAATTIVASMGCVANDRITVSASNMGDVKQATVIVYLK